MRAITFALYGLTLVAAYGQNLADIPFGHSTPSAAPPAVLKDHFDGSIPASSSTLEYVPVVEYRDAVDATKPRSLRQNSVVFEIKKNQTPRPIRMPLIFATALDLRPVEK